MTLFVCFCASGGFSTLANLARCSEITIMYLFMFHPIHGFTPLCVWWFFVAGKFTISAGNTIMPVYTAELYPTAIRNAGVGACNVAAGVALIIVPYLSLLVSFELGNVLQYIRISFQYNYGCGVVGDKGRGRMLFWEPYWCERNIVMLPINLIY